MAWNSVEHWIAHYTNEHKSNPSAAAVNLVHALVYVLQLSMFAKVIRPASLDKSSYQHQLRPVYGTERAQQWSRAIKDSQQLQ